MWCGWNGMVSRPHPCQTQRLPPLPWFLYLRETSTYTQWMGIVHELRYTSSPRTKSQANSSLCNLPTTRPPARRNPPMRTGCCPRRTKDPVLVIRPVRGWLGLHIEEWSWSYRLFEVHWQLATRLPSQTTRHDETSRFVRFVHATDRALALRARVG